jgi:hypothetical protein
MERERLFQRTWNFKSLLILAAGLAALGVLSLVGYEVYKVKTRTRQVHNVVNVEPDTRIEYEWALGTFERVPGTDYVMAAAHSKQSYHASYYEKDASALRNYLFVNVADKSSRWLVPTNKYLFLRAERLRQEAKPEGGAGKGAEAQQGGEAVKWLMYEVVKSDTDRDSRLTAKDQRAVAVSGAAGEGYKEVIDNVDQTLGSMLRDENTLLVFHSTGGSSYVSEVDLPGRQVSVTRELPKMQPQ